MFHETIIPASEDTDKVKANVESDYGSTQQEDNDHLSDSSEEGQELEPKDIASFDQEIIDEFDNYKSKSSKM